MANPPCLGQIYMFYFVITINIKGIYLLLEKKPLFMVNNELSYFIIIKQINRYSGFLLLCKALSVSRRINTFQSYDVIHTQTMIRM